MKSTIVLIPLLAATILLTACQKDKQAAMQQPLTADAAADKPLPNPGGTSPGKPQAPISMRYEIVGNPVVGQPVQINVMVSSPEGPVEVLYSITDRSALVFQDGQVERIEIVDPSSDAGRQLSVIPQREGRLYVNVSAQVQTPSGPMIRSMSIPIKVGAAPAKPTPNGEVVEGPDGEAVISMPAKETN